VHTSTRIERGEIKGREINTRQLVMPSDLNDLSRNLIFTGEEVICDHIQGIRRVALNRFKSTLAAEVTAGKVKFLH
jgi:hypothetical protein